MKILFLHTEPCYPPTNGIRLKSFNALKLMARDNRLMLASQIAPEAEPYDFAPLRQLCEEVVAVPIPRQSPALVAAKALLHRRMYYMQRFLSPIFRNHVLKMVADFQPNVVHFDYIQTTLYRDCIPPGIGTVASINDSFAFATLNSLRQNIEKSAFRRIYRTLQYPQVRRYEASVYPKFDIVHTMTEIDAAFLRSLNPRIVTHAIPNGTYVEQFAQVSQRMLPNHVVFVAKYSPHNIEPLINFLNIAWAGIRRADPNAVLHVVGRDMNKSAQSVEIAKRLGGVTFDGFVEHLPDAYRMPSIAIVPIDKNCGVVNKAIEGMAAGMCMVSFRRTLQGIPDVTPGSDCLAVDSFHQMADAILTVMRDTSRLRQIQENARQTAVRCFSWESRRPLYHQMYQRAASLAAARI